MRQKQLVAGYLAYGGIEVLTVGAIRLLLTCLCLAGFWFIASVCVPVCCTCFRSCLVMLHLAYTVR